MVFPSMKLRTKYILFVITVHLAALVLSYFVFRESKLLFLLAEILILLSVVLSWQLYRQLLQPLRTLLQGTNAIRDRDFNVKFLPTGKYEMDELIQVYNHMMDRLREEGIRQQQQHFFLEKLIHTSPTGIIILDYDQRIQQLNPKAEQILGMTATELLDKDAGLFTHVLLKEMAVLQTGQSATVNTPKGETYKIQKSHFIDRGFARYFVMLEELTAEILAAEKNAYGKVIRMMAHEVNNTIGPVNSILQSARDAGQQQMVHEALGVAIERNNNLNVFMRNFADVVRLPVPVRKPLDINPLAEQTARLMEPSAREKQIDIVLSLAPGPLNVAADAAQLEQALVNIIKNAVEAIGTNGTIHVITSMQPPQLIIRDTGPGIAPEVAARLFSAFYSTKPDGQGIGLTLVRDVLTAHGFSFSLSSEGKPYTDFLVTF